MGAAFNLNDGTYRLFHKPNEQTIFIHVESDHPSQIIKQLPRSIEKILSSLSSKKKIFENSKDYYEQRLRHADITKNKLHRRKQQNKSKISEAQHTLVQPTLQ